ncbi:TatD family hydrolase [Oscillatoria sp. CS-180]|uniref:TatD family hydrolase n=1 Tax=Oscillatoria sp. CS-180 TaxID=3021720 RepID=UPI00232B79F4|nr:TatD family hydrolase [Oscillatoria sp. CS-180]MDB9524682.1 TatD family hydrolase [Oscillatoria sp. CS-180]
MQLIDTHVHINFETFRPDLDEVAAAWRAAGITHLIHSCVEPSEFEGMQAIADRYPEVSLSVGLHPLDMDKWTPDIAAQIETLARSDRRVVAIGETGLDFYKADDKLVQEKSFWEQLTIAKSLDLPVIIHCRDAAIEAARLIETFQAERGAIAGVMHCWSGTPEETQLFLDLGFYISFSGIVTFKNAHQVKASACQVPTDRLLVETDCPFLTPVPKRKERRNQPANVAHVANYLAELRQEPLEFLAERTTANAMRLFKLSSAKEKDCEASREGNRFSEPTGVS